jgi:hypothetical protein
MKNKSYFPFYFHVLLSLTSTPNGPLMDQMPHPYLHFPFNYP